MTHRNLDFTGIGTTKAASTWFFKCLSEHPQVNASREKEMRFFDNLHNFNRGLRWYFSFFPDAQPGQVSGEFSPSYLYSADTAKRIKESFPNVKMIAVFRNPVDKIYSSYWSNKTGGRGSMVGFDSFEEALDGVVGMRETALHGAQLANYLELFPKSQIHTLLYDDVRADPEKVMRDIYMFLGIDENFVAPSTHRGVNETGDKRIKYPWLFKFFYGAYWRIKKIPWLLRFVQMFNPTRISIMLRNIGTRKGGEKFKKPEMNPETRERLRKFYADDVKLLGELIGRDLSAWK